MRQYAQSSSTDNPSNILHILPSRFPDIQHLHLGPSRRSVPSHRATIANRLLGPLKTDRPLRPHDSPAQFPVLPGGAEERPRVVLVQLAALPGRACAVQAWRSPREEQVGEGEVLGGAGAGAGCDECVELDEEARRGCGRGCGYGAEEFGGPEAGYDAGCWGQVCDWRAGRHGFGEVGAEEGGWSGAWRDGWEGRHLPRRLRSWWRLARRLQRGGYHTLEVFFEPGGLDVR